MNNFLEIAKRRIVGRGSTPIYTSYEPVKYLTNSTIDNFGEWFDQGSVIDEDGLISKFDGFENDMLCQLGGFNSLNISDLGAGQKNILCFRAPCIGQVRLIRKKNRAPSIKGRWLMVYTQLNNNELKVTLPLTDSLNHIVTIGNSLVLGRKDDEFDDETAKNILQKLMVDYILKEVSLDAEPTAGPILINQRGVSRTLFTSTELISIKASSDKNTDAWALSFSKFQNITDVAPDQDDQLFDFSFPVYGGEIVPLYTLQNASSLARVKLRLGFAEVPFKKSDRRRNGRPFYHYNDGYTWFEPSTLLQRFKFEPKLEISNGSNLFHTDKIIAWHAHESLNNSQRNEIRIKKIENQFCVYYNPKQVFYLNRLGNSYKQAKDNDASNKISFFQANGGVGTDCIANFSGLWNKRHGRDLRPESRAFDKLSRSQFESVNPLTHSSININILDNLVLSQIKVTKNTRLQSHAHVITNKLSVNIPLSKKRELLRLFRIPENGFQGLTGYTDTIEFSTDNIKLILVGFINQHTKNHILRCINIVSSESDPAKLFNTEEIDLPLALVTGAREGSRKYRHLIYSRNESNRILTCGGDMHPMGRSGLDYFYDRASHTSNRPSRWWPTVLADHIHQVVRNGRIISPRPSGLRGNFNRKAHGKNSSGVRDLNEPIVKNPAMIREIDLLVAHIIEAQARFKRFLSLFNTKLSNDFTVLEREALINNMETRSKRGWIQAAFGTFLGALLTRQRDIMLGKNLDEIIADPTLNLNSIIYNEELLENNLSRQRCRITAAEAELVEFYLPPELS